MSINTQKRARSFGTHDGTFHADEVTACALLLLFDRIDKDKIVRTREHDILATCEYVCDVGWIYDPEQKLFDHHQVEYQGSLSSAGMILLYLKDSGKISQNEYDYFNQTLILGVDAHDNGKDTQVPGFCSYSLIIGSFNPIIHDADAATLNKSFLEAVDFATAFLDRLKKKYQYTKACRQVVEKAMQKKNECLIFDQNIPWLDSFFELDGTNHPALFVIMPSGKHWKLRGIPPSTDQRMKVRFPLPQSWAGLSDEDLQRVSGIPGAVFCHKGRFISVWETLEDAVKALQKTLQTVQECK